MNSTNQKKKCLAECIIILAAAASVLKIKKEKKKRDTWSRKWLLRRKQLGCYENLMQELALEDSEGYRRWLRMDTNTFEYFLSEVSPYITKKDTRFREAIPAGERLSITLRYLATGETQSSQAYQFRIAQNTISGIIQKTLRAIYHVLKEKYLKMPTSAKEWEVIAKDLRWNFPMCLGALDGKHVKITPPPNSGSTYFNYKGDFSIVMLALVDANLKFIYLDVGTNGRISDGGIFAKSTLKRALDANSLNIPEANTLLDTNIPVPYIIVADGAFLITTSIMKPYPGKNLSTEQIIFNYRLSRARRVVENAFGLLAARFQVFKAKLITSPSNAKMIILTTCCLHNMMRTMSSNIYSSEESIDREDIENNTITHGEWRSYINGFVPVRGNRTRTNQYAKEIQRRFCMYFNSSGAVPWQKEMCHLH